MGGLAARLLMRGDSIAIEQGRLIILPASGIPVPDKWLAEHGDNLVAEVVRATGLDAFRYTGYSTGLYEVKKGIKKPGLRLHLVSLATDEDVTAFFNADIYRARNTKGGKAGAPLPKGEFRVGERSAFYKFWLSTGLVIPNRVAKLHKHMGTLRRVLLTGELSDGRINAQSLEPLSIEAGAVRLAVFGDKEGTRKGQAGDKEGTETRDKETPQSHTPQGLQQIPTACASSCVDKYTSRHVYKGEDTNPLPNTKHPEDQTHEEWLADYEAAQNQTNFI